MSKKFNKAGFSLIEMSLVLAIVGIMLSGGLSMVLSQASTSRYVDTANKVEHIKDMLLSFAMVNAYLPCPVNTTGGLSSGKKIIVSNDKGFTYKCEVSEGSVPYLTLGLSLEDVTDSFGNIIKYSIVSKTAIVNDVCADKQSSVAYFCKTLTVPLFDINTYPIQILDLSGNGVTLEDNHDIFGTFFICNEKVLGKKNCNKEAMYSQNGNVISKYVEAYNVIAVIQAHNFKVGEDCGDMTYKDLENCDNDRYFIKTKKSKSYITYITAMELKSKIFR